MSNNDIEITSLTSLDDVVYELSIRGELEEVMSVDVSFITKSSPPPVRVLSNIVITPNVRTTVLHKASEQTTDNNTTTEDKKISLPVTGQNKVEFILVGLGMMLIGGTILIRKRN